MVGGVSSGRRDKIGLFPVVVLLSLIELLLSFAWSVIVLLVAGLVSLVEFLLVAALPVTARPVIILPVTLLITARPVTLLNTIVSVILLIIVPVVLVVILSRLEFPFLFMLTSVPVVHLS